MKKLFLTIESNDNRRILKNANNVHISYFNHPTNTTYIFFASDSEFMLNTRDIAFHNDKARRGIGRYQKEYVSIAIFVNFIGMEYFKEFIE